MHEGLRFDERVGRSGGLQVVTPSQPKGGSVTCNIREGEDYVRLSLETNQYIKRLRDASSTTGDLRQIHVKPLQVGIRQLMHHHLFEHHHEYNSKQKLRVFMHAFLAPGLTGLDSRDRYRHAANEPTLKHPSCLRPMYPISMSGNSQTSCIFSGNLIFVARADFYVKPMSPNCATGACQSCVLGGKHPAV